MADVANRVTNECRTAKRSMSFHRPLLFILCVSAFELKRVNRHANVNGGSFNMSEKPARRRSEISADVLIELNSGHRESRTLVEGLAIDFDVLYRNVVPSARRTGRQFDPKMGIVLRMKRAAELLEKEFIPEFDSPEQGFESLCAHPSDTVRGWGAFVGANIKSRSVSQRLQRLHRLADDGHFGVREWVWMAARPFIANDLTAAIGALAKWSRHSSENVRRFASEATRPRGVWCKQIKELVTTPELALPVIEPLMADQSRYVQVSVGNWLNDAGKSRPDWVRQFVAQWLEQSQQPATAAICRHGMRRLK